MICPKVKEYKHIFGPVPSRRLGRSLGVDIIPFKTCSYDCVYCQLGKTTEKSILRKEYSPVSDVLEEIRAKLEESANLKGRLRELRQTIEAERKSLSEAIKEERAERLAFLGGNWASVSVKVTTP